MIEIYNSKNYSTLTFQDDNEWDRLIKKWLLPFVKKGTKKYIENLDAEFFLLKIDNLILPVTINSKKENSYIANPYNYLDYSRDEIAKEIHNFSLKFFLNQLVNICQIFFKIGSLEKVVCVNNWLVSTNVVPNLSSDQIVRITNFLKKKYPDLAIIWRSINDFHHEEIQDNFKKADYRKITSRQICLVDPSKSIYFSKTQKEHLKRDKKLLEKTDYSLTSNFGDSIDTARLKELYDQLYIKKYSKNNPQYTLDFFELAKQNQFFVTTFFKKNDEVDAFGLSFVLNNIISNPIIGYDISKPKKNKLYRMLAYRLFEIAKNNKYFSHRSSGVSSFKKLRGAFECLEYFMVYTDHLTAKQKAGWIVFEFVINKIATPIVQKLKL